MSPLLGEAEHDGVREVLREDVLSLLEPGLCRLRSRDVRAEAAHSANEPGAPGRSPGHGMGSGQQHDARDDHGHSDQSEVRLRGQDHHQRDPSQQQEDPPAVPPRPNLVGTLREPAPLDRVRVQRVLHLVKTRHEVLLQAGQEHPLSRVGR